MLTAMQTYNADVVAREVEAAASSIAKRVREGDFADALEGLQILISKVLYLRRQEGSLTGNRSVSP